MSTQRPGNGLHLCRIAVSDKAIRQHRLAVASGVEFPKLARLWFDPGRDQTMNRLADYLSGEVAAGRLKMQGAGSGSAYVWRNDPVLPVPAALDWLALSFARGNQGHRERGR